MASSTSTALSCPVAPEQILPVNLAANVVAESQQERTSKTEAETKQTISYLTSDKALASLDFKGAGVISLGTIRQAAYKIRNLKRLIAILLMLVAFLLLGTFAASYMAIQMSMEMHVRNGSLVDNSQHAVATIQRVESIMGVRSDTSRRLSNATNESNATNVQDSPANLTDSSSYSDLMVDPATFYETIDGYKGGKSSWVVPLPDGTVRTISIQGSATNSAWGLCGVCHERLVWIVSCPASTNTSDMCPISWELTGSVRRTAELSTTSRLLRGSEASMKQHNLVTRAMQSRTESFEQGMDRSLTSKSCV